ncbi:hypothetical protein [Bacillus sp. 03113]|uniref:hypothetical protein n=1 Tax=Bacillus sp. 03113 TaxID=2578211 RepID=UPI001142EAB9|nr:hypothetical protein [Bacillus sp. 03113]
MYIVQIPHNQYEQYAQRISSFNHQAPYTYLPVNKISPVETMIKKEWTVPFALKNKEKEKRKQFNQSFHQLTGKGLHFDKKI